MRTLIFGDLHLGDGRSRDDSDWPTAAAIPAMIRAHDDAPLRLVLNGDIVDFLRASARTTGLDPEPALPQIDAILQRWPAVFGAFEHVLAQGGEIVWRCGCRDLPLSLGGVQQRVRRALGDRAGLRFEPIDQPTILRFGAAKVGVSHGAHADPNERVRFDQLPGDGGATPGFRGSRGAVLARKALLPLSEAGVRFADLVGPRVAAGVLAATAIDPSAFARVRVTHGLRVDWDALLGRRPRRAPDDPLDLTAAIAALDLGAVSISEMRAALARGRADEIDRWRVSALRAWAKGYEVDAAGRTRLQPARAEWTEARRIKRLFDVDAVVLGHTHLPRWGADAGLLYINPGTWLPRLQVPSARDDDTVWAELISRLARDLDFTGAAQDAIRQERTVVLIEPSGKGAGISLQRWDGDALVPMAVAGGTCHAMIGTGTTTFQVRRAQARRRCRPLLADAHRGQPLLDAGVLPPPGLLFPVERRPPDAPADVGLGNPHDLADQRWGVVVAQGRWPVYRDALAPLIALREAEMDARAEIVEVAPVQVLDVPAAVAWVSAHWLTRPHQARPGYLLLIGDLVELPLAVQQVLATVASVGRLAFVTAAGAPDLPAYRAYADKLVRWSHQPIHAPRAPMHAWVAEDGSRAIDAGGRALVDPAIGALTLDSNRPFQAVKRLVLPAMQPSAAQLLAHPALQRTQVLFTLAHGAAPPPGGYTSDERRRTQGALSLGAGAFMADAAAAKGPMAAGGIWFAFGSLSAGTAPTSAYAEWLGRIDNPDARVLADAFDGPPFIAALPQAALANPDGPLAFIGHVDLAWTFGWHVSLPGGDDLQLHDRISLVLAALGGGRAGVWRRGGPGRVGHALRHLGTAAARYAEALADRRRAQSEGQVPAQAVDQIDGALWLARQDLESYILLGDPATHLPLAPPPSAPPTAMRAGRAPTDAPTRPDLRPVIDDAPVRGVIRSAEDALVARFMRAGRATLPTHGRAEAEARVLAFLAGEPLGAAVQALAEAYVAAGRAAIGVQ